MTRLYGAITVLVIVTALVIFSFNFNVKTVDSVSEKVSEAVELIRDGKYDPAVGAMTKAKDIWDKRSETMLLFISHGKADEIETCITSAEAYLLCGEKNLFLADGAKIITLLEHFKNVEYPELNNIF